MLRELLLRDARTHWRILIGAGISLVLILATWMLASWGEPFESESVGSILGIGLVLASLIPLSLHMREVMSGTLGDLLALPVSRREIARLRYVEGILACVLYGVFYLVVCAIHYHPSLRILAQVTISPALFWVPAAVLGYLLPFGLRSPRWLGWAYVIPAGGGAAATVLLAWWDPGMEHMTHVFTPMLQMWEKLHGYGFGACLLDYVAPSLVLLVSYRIAVWVFERTDA